MKKLIYACLIIFVIVISGCAQTVQAPEPTGPTADYSVHIAATKHAATKPDLFVHHFCKGLPTGMMQCQLYDNDADDARLIGIEMIVPSEDYETFDEDEKKNWHGHVEELEIVQMQTFDMTDAEVDGLVEALSKTHGKIFITWDPTRDYPDKDPTVTIVK